MPPLSRSTAALAATCIALLVGACATTADAPLAAGTQATISGSISAIDTQPWTYDGNAIVQVDTREHGRVAVQLPARWNLCKAAPVDVQALAVGMRVQAVGLVGGEGEMVVCGDEAHRLARAE